MSPAVFFMIMGNRLLLLPAAPLNSSPVFAAGLLLLPLLQTLSLFYRTQTHDPQSVPFCLMKGELERERKRTEEKVFS